MELDVNNVWETYGLDELQEGLDSLFPQYQLPVQNMLEKILSGNVLGVVSDVFLSGAQVILQQFENLTSTSSVPSIITPEEALCRFCGACGSAVGYTGGSGACAEGHGLCAASARGTGYDG